MVAIPKKILMLNSKQMWMLSLVKKIIRTFEKMEKTWKKLENYRLLFARRLNYKQLCG